MANNTESYNFPSDLLSLEQSKEIYESLYQGIDTYQVSLNSKKRQSTNDPNYTYGEINFDSFVEILKLCNPSPNSTFYDLGSGTGKAIIVAYLTNSFSKITGVEIIHELHETATLIKTKLEEPLAKFGNLLSTAPIHFIEDSLFNTNINDADIIFMNSTCYGEKMMYDIAKLLKDIKIGTKIITFSKRIPALEYFIFHKEKHKMGWGTISVFIQEKI